MYYLQVTEANHVENQFFTLGGAGFETEEARQASIDMIPVLEDHDCQNPNVNRCYLIDVCDENFDYTDNFEISEQTAHEILGVDNFDPLRDKERALYQAVMSV